MYSYLVIHNDGAREVKKLVRVAAKPNIEQEIRSVFGFEDAKLLLKVFNQEFKEFVDIDSYADLPDRSRLGVSLLGLNDAR